VIRAAALALVAVLCAPSIARAGDPAWRWRTIDTEHFQIHYYTFSDGRIGEERVAQRLAVIAEAARARLVPLLGPGLPRKTHVTITDDTDEYNGSASVQPYPNIRLYATSPDDRAELNDYDEWLWGLFMHEYTHILHTGTIFGPCAKVINWVLGLGVGTLYSPNQAQPRFIIEGLAVFEESERTSGGRLRNAIWDMYLRAATLENKLMRLDQFTNFPTLFPYGNAAYLYGSALMRFVARRYGEGALARHSRDYGSVCIPGGLNRAIRHVTKKTWMQLYDDFVADLRARYGAQRDAIAARGITPARVLTETRQFIARPVFTPDGASVIYADSDGYTRSQLRRMDLATGRAVTELQVDGASGASLSADGRWLAFHAIDVWRTFYFYNDVYLYDRSKREKRRLTEGLRATNPALSPDGKRLAFEVNDSSSRGLGLYDVERGAVEMLIPARGFEQVYTPAFSPDGKTLAFSWWRTGGWRDIYTLDLETRRTTAITHDRALDMEPRFSPDGKWLYFVSDRSEVHNLYAYELATGKTYQSTNVVNGVFDPAISPDGKRVVFVGFHARGYDLEVAELDPRAFGEAAPAVVEQLAPDALPPPPDAPPLPSRKYNPFPTVLPWTISPYAAPDGYGELLGVRLSGGDVAGRHAWSLDVAAGTGRADDFHFSAGYAYYGLWPSLSLGVGRSLGPRGGQFVNGEARALDEEDWSAGASVGLPILRTLVSSSDLAFSYSVTWSRLMQPGVPIDPSLITPVVPRDGRTAGVGVTWSFRNDRRFLFSVSSEEGRVVGLSLGVGAKFLGSQFDTYSVSWFWHEFVPIRWQRAGFRNHVLALSYAGGVAGGDPNHRGGFFLGGYPPQDLLKSIYDFSRPGSATLRGYPYGSVGGDMFHLLNVEYRFPIMWIERGYQTFPFYMRRLHGKVFADYGGAFTHGFEADKLKLGVGAEVILEIDYAYFYAASLQLGYAYGVNAGGGSQVYFLLNYPF
jgi:Tol biopolymer transport system component